jgi:hypothetical protein
VHCADIYHSLKTFSYNVQTFYICLHIFRRGYADGEIEALFAKYDIDGDRVLDQGEQKRMQADLNDQKVRKCVAIS